MSTSPVMENVSVQQQLFVKVEPHRVSYGGSHSHPIVRPHHGHVPHPLTGPLLSAAPRVPDLHHDSGFSSNTSFSFSGNTSLNSSEKPSVSTSRTFAVKSETPAPKKPSQLHKLSVDFLTGNDTKSTDTRHHPSPAPSDDAKCSVDSGFISSDSTHQTHDSPSSFLHQDFSVSRLSSDDRVRSIVPPSLPLAKSAVPPHIASPALGHSFSSRHQSPTLPSQTRPSVLPFKDTMFSPIQDNVFSPIYRASHETSVHTPASKVLHQPSPVYGGFTAGSPFMASTPYVHHRPIPKSFEQSQHRIHQDSDLKPTFPVLSENNVQQFHANIFSRVKNNVGVIRHREASPEDIPSAKRQRIDSPLMRHVHMTSPMMPVNGPVSPSITALHPGYRSVQQLSPAFGSEVPRCQTPEKAYVDILVRMKEKGQADVEIINGGYGVKNPHYVAEASENDPVPVAQDGKFLCRVCNKEFALQRLLNRHMKCHSDAKRYLCIVCGKGFNDTFDLKRHTRIHTGVKPYKCDNCDKRFTQRCSLESHCKKVHNCDIAFRYKERRDKVYVCEECGHSTEEAKAHYSHLKKNHPHCPALTKAHDKRQFKFKGDNLPSPLKPRNS